jgi:tetratricopeptide (TPR) repeat protein
LLRRFVEEAQIGGQLQHPGIVPVYELGHGANRYPYFTMKLVKGQTLAQLLKEHPARGGRQSPVETSKQGVDVPRAPDDLPRFLGIFEQVCQTVAYAHARGVIHRDLKPGNIMVGAFGEVQVMDWGLAKVLPPRPGAGAAVNPAEITTIISTARRPGTDAPASPHADTEPGSVLGTPPYMSPEQARGDVDRLDERCDVFSLGAILCEILTGQPPYQGPDGGAILVKAAHAQLGPARDRLDRCGADRELVDLARHCLEPECDRRPRQAAEVAAAMTCYLQSLQQKLRRAELERTEAEVKAAEAQKRRLVEGQKRRVTVALAATLLLLVTGAAGAGLWYQHEQGRLTQEQAEHEADDLRHQTELAEKKAELARATADREAEQTAQKKYLEKEIATALTEAEALHGQLHQKLGNPKTVTALLSNLDEWKTLVGAARAAWQRAAALAKSNEALLAPVWISRLKELDGQLNADHNDLQLASKLDTIRSEAFAVIGAELNLTAAGPRYALEFGQLGLDPTKGGSAEVAKTIKQLPLRYVLVASLDHWAAVANDLTLATGLMQAARLADPDPWRDQVRDPKNWKNKAGLQKLADQADLGAHSPQVIFLLAWCLKHSGGEAAPLLRQALVHHPDDFWLNFSLGALAQTAVEQMSCYQAALAIRPRSSVAYFNVGAILLSQQKKQEAIICFNKAIALSPKFALPHMNLGNVFLDKKDYDQAGDCYQKAIQLDSKSPVSHYNMGYVLYLKKDLAGAIPYYEKAIALDPKYALAHISLGNAFLDKKDYDKAGGCYQKAIQLDPNSPVSHYNMGYLLYLKKDLKGALPYYEMALALDPEYIPTHLGLGDTLLAKKDYSGAIPYYQKAVDIAPTAAVHLNLGAALYETKNLTAAIQHYHKALAFNPKYAKAHCNLGAALVDLKDFSGAVAACKKAIDLDPNLAAARIGLGLALQGQGQFAEALAEFKKTQELEIKQSGWSPKMVELLQPPWSWPTAQRIKTCEKWIALDKKLPAVLAGQMKPGDVIERIEFAELCYKYKKLPATAVRMYQDAFAEDPKLAVPHQYHAASAAALAAAGQGADVGQLAAKEKSKLRQQALDWLKADLLNLKAQAANAKDAAAVQMTLKLWQINPDLAAVRDPQALAKLPEPEGKAWQQLWSEVEETLSTVQK